MLTPLERELLDALKERTRYDVLASHAIPTIGKFIVRINKKDGTPSVRFDTFDVSYGSKTISLPYGWYPEGMDPNTKGKG